MVRAMKRFGVAISLLLLSIAICAASSNTVVNLSHYDMMRPDFVRMRSEGVTSVTRNIPRGSTMH
jgi:hypothetical protein